MELNYVCAREPARQILLHEHVLRFLRGQVLRVLAERLRAGGIDGLGEIAPGPRTVAKLHPVQRPVSVHHREPRTSLPRRRKSVHRCGTLAISHRSRRGHCPYAGHIGLVTHT